MKINKEDYGYGLRLRDNGVKLVLINNNNKLEIDAVNPVKIVETIIFDNNDELIEYYYSNSLGLEPGDSIRIKTNSESGSEIVLCDVDFKYFLYDYKFNGGWLEINDEMFPDGFAGAYCIANNFKDVMYEVNNYNESANEKVLLHSKNELFDYIEKVKITHPDNIKDKLYIKVFDKRPIKHEEVTNPLIYAYLTEFDIEDKIIKSMKG